FMPHSIYFIDPNIGWAAGYENFTNFGLIYKTTNGGENWVNQLVGVNSRLSDIYFINENTGWTVGGDGIILHTTDGGLNWIPQVSGTSNNLYSVHFVNENTGWVVGENGTILKTTNGGIIPVELTSFTAIAQSNYVELNWTTATEINNLGFEIERSEDNVSFNKIGFVPGFGTTTEPKSYSYSDQSVYSGTFYYRLKQVDYDGSFEYSAVVEVELGVLNSYILEQNYPNPFNPSTKIRYSVPNTSQVIIKIYDVLSKEIETLVNEEKQTGTYKLTWNAANIPSGVYFYTLDAVSISGNKQTKIGKKMIIIK
ncbi:MAG: YCF48-related protein, partial [Ignavibacteria bacterium]|nr:YCF48-related protein [Ignavibacteria bacterium]